MDALFGIDKLLNFGFVAEQAIAGTKPPIPPVKKVLRVHSN